MKNDTHNQIKQGRETATHKALSTDMLIIPEVVRHNQAKLAHRPRRRRRIDYAKKISNDSLIMNA